MAKRVTNRPLMRKLRTGHWASQGQGSGGTGDGGSGTGTDDNDDEDDDDLDDDEDDGDDDKGKGDDKGKSKGDDPVAKANAEAKRRRLQAREARERADALQAELDGIKNKDKPELDRIKVELDQVKVTLEKVTGDRDKYMTRAIVAETAGEVGITNLKYTRYLLSEEYPDLDPSEDGYEDDLKDAMKALAKKHPDIAAASDSKKKKDDDKGGEDLPGQGSRQNGNKQKGGAPDAATLAKKYPALRR